MICLLACLFHFACDYDSFHFWERFLNPQYTIWDISLFFMFQFIFLFELVGAMNNFVTLHVVF